MKWEGEGESVRERRPFKKKLHFFFQCKLNKVIFLRGGIKYKKRTKKKKNKKKNWDGREVSNPFNFIYIRDVG